MSSHKVYEDKHILDARDTLNNNDFDSNDDQDWCAPDSSDKASSLCYNIGRRDGLGNSARHKSRVPEEVRLRINSRERQRMHDINSALDSLRQVLLIINTFFLFLFVITYC